MPSTDRRTRRIALLATAACVTVAVAGYLLGPRTTEPVPAAWATQVASADPSFAGLTANGLAAYAAGDLTTARAAFEAALARQPESPAALFNVAVVAAASGDTAAAEAAYRAVLALAPGDATASWNLGLLLYEAGDRGESRDLLRIALELDPSLSSRLPADVELG